MNTLILNLSFALCLRLILVIYGALHDSMSILKFTDVDYFVFTDAARFISQGESPYKRDTYRYTPLLSWALVPNICIHHTWGKLLFITCDMLTAILIYKVLRKCGTSRKTAFFAMQLWLFNPLTMTISSRGNAESVMAVLVIASLFLIMTNADNHRSSYSLIGYILYALSVHIKIYPVTYSLPFYLYLKDSQSSSGPISTVFQRLYVYFWPNKERIKLVLTFIIVLTVTTGACYYKYGHEFIQETYLYHITRTDTRHNFSVYFYLLYLTTEAAYTKLLGVLLFIPQAVILLATSLKFHEELPFCCFLNTFIFVTFNKVCTSQYFLWYICLLPLIIPKLRLSRKESYSCVILWLIGQALWLLPAYCLEFEGYNTFVLIWAAGLVFFIINISIVCLLLARYDPKLQNELTPISFFKEDVVKYKRS